MNWKDKVVLVTGGTGSFGRKFIEVMLADYQPAKLIVFSRDELYRRRARCVAPWTGDARRGCGGSRGCVEASASL